MSWSEWKERQGAWYDFCIAAPAVVLIVLFWTTFWLPTALLGGASLLIKKSD